MPLTKEDGDTSKQTKSLWVLKTNGHPEMEVNLYFIFLECLSGFQLASRWRDPSKRWCRISTISSPWEIYLIYTSFGNNLIIAPRSKELWIKTMMKRKGRLKATRKADGFHVTYINLGQSIMNFRLFYQWNMLCAPKFQYSWTSQWADMWQKTTCDHEVYILGA